MKKKSLIISITIVVIIALIVAVCIFISSKTEETKNTDNIAMDEEMNNENSNEVNIEENKEKTVEELKNEVNATADSDIYEVATEYDGRKILAVKSSVSFKVAFAGSINSNLKTTDEADSIMEANFPNKTGIYLKNKGNKFLEYVNKYCSSKYTVSEDGYLIVEENKEKNEFDNVIQSAMNKNKIYLIFCDGVIKNVDNITGEIMNYDFENIDPYQVYEYVEDEDKVFIELTSNKNNKLDPKYIFESVKELFGNM